MKEKEVDTYLSLAALGHLLLVGTGGTFFIEVFAEKARFEVMYLSGYFAIMIVIGLTLIYNQAFAISKNKKL